MKSNSPLLVTTGYQMYTLFDLDRIVYFDPISILLLEFRMDTETAEADTVHHKFDSCGMRASLQCVKNHPKFETKNEKNLTTPFNPLCPRYEISHFGAII